MSQSYFLGCNSADGFVSLFNELYDAYDGWTMYIIKGGPGTGKSTLMKNLCKYADSKKIKYEKIYCSSDPNSLDGVIFSELKISIADGTPPHVLEPKFPGAVENLVTLNNFWNRDMLKKNRKDIIKYSTLISAEHAKCIRYLKAADIIQSEINREVLLNTDTDKLKRFILREIRRNADETSINKTPIIKNRIINALTPDGMVFFKESVNSQCDDITVFKDDYSVLSQIIIEELSSFYKSEHKDIIKCKSFLNPNKLTDHIILPEKRKAFLTDNYNFNFSTDKNLIHVSRFYKKTILNEKETLNSALNAKKKAIETASEHLKKAKELHDKLESYYIEAMDFDALNDYTSKTIKEILK